MIDTTSEFSNRYTLVHLVSDMDGAVQQNLLALIIFAVLVAIFVVADLLAKRRFRAVTLTLTTTLALLAPLMGVYTAAYNLMNTFIGATNAGVGDLSIFYYSFAESAFCLAFGALVGMVAVIARMALKLDERGTGRERDQA